VGEQSSYPPPHHFPLALDPLTPQSLLEVLEGRTHADALKKPPAPSPSYLPPSLPPDPNSPQSLLEALEGRTRAVAQRKAAEGPIEEEEEENSSYLPGQTPAATTAAAAAEANEAATAAQEAGGSGEVEEGPSVADQTPRQSHLPPTSHEAVAVDVEGGSPPRAVGVGVVGPLPRVAG
jgi:hypothetical protein